MPALSDDLFEAAELVARDFQSFVAEDLNCWAQIPQARYRTAISRAYYSVFCAMKLRIIECRSDRFFPRHDAHRKLREATAAVLGVSHAIPRMLSSLLRRRKEADYELDRAVFQFDAEQSLDEAQTALDLIATLPGEQMMSIANSLYDNEDRRFSSFENSLKARSLVSAPVSHNRVHAVPLQPVK